MNATPSLAEEAAERRARHMRICQELIERGMKLTRAAAREAMRDLQAPLEHRMPAAAAEPACRAPDPGSLFIRLSRAVRQAILLEARLAAGFPPLWQARLAQEPARIPPQQPGTRPQGGQPAREALERLDDDFANGPFSPESVPEILDAIRGELNLVPVSPRGETALAAPCQPPPAPHKPKHWHARHKVPPRPG